MMPQLMPIFRLLPALLFVFGILLTAANIIEMRATSASAAIGSTFLNVERTVYLVGIVRSFYDLFFLWGMAAVVTAANKYLEEKGFA